MTEWDVNAQHLSAMGLSGARLGEPFDEQRFKAERFTEPLGPEQCAVHHPNNLRVRCLLKQGHTTRHVRGALHWSDNDIDESYIEGNSIDVVQAIAEFLDAAWPVTGGRSEIVMALAQALVDRDSDRDRTFFE